MVSSQLQRLGDAYAGAGQQAEEGAVCSRAKRVCGRQPTGGVHQFLKLLVTVQVRLLTEGLGAQQSQLGYFSSAVDGSQMAREGSHNRQPPGAIAI